MESDDSRYGIRHKAGWNHHAVMYEKGGDRRSAPLASPCHRLASGRCSAAGNRTLCAFRAKWVLSTSARQKRKPPKSNAITARAVYGIARRACVWNPPQVVWNHHAVMYEKGGDRRYAPFASPCRRSASYRRSAAGNRTLCAFRAKWVLSTSARQKRKPPKGGFLFWWTRWGSNP